MLYRRPPRRRERLEATASPRRRRTRSRRSRPGAGRAATGRWSLRTPASHLGRTFYCLRTPEGDICAGRVRQGTCLLLFTSPAAASAFADFRGVEAWPPLVFSRSPSEFQTQAAQCFGRGYVGGLV